jgi:hypothetical protein
MVFQVRDISGGRFVALKGQYFSAQGNAMGKGNQIEQSPEGATQVGLSHLIGFALGSPMP